MKPVTTKHVWFVILLLKLTDMARIARVLSSTIHQILMRGTTEVRAVPSTATNLFGSENFKMLKNPIHYSNPFRMQNPPNKIGPTNRTPSGSITAKLLRTPSIIRQKTPPNEEE
jgi:hypothetical protein